MVTQEKNLSKDTLLTDYRLISSLLDEPELIALVGDAFTIGVWIGHGHVSMHGSLVDVSLWSGWSWGVGWRGTCVDIPIKELQMQCTQLKDTSQGGWKLHIELLEDDIC